MIGRAILAAWAASSIAGCAPRIDVGASCERPSDCPAPLSCLLGRCRNACETDRDCPASGSCVPAGSGLGACTYDVENTCTAAVCEAPLSCIEGRCRASCVSDVDCLASQRCDGAVCRSADALDGGAPDSGADVGHDAAADAGPSDAPPSSVVPARLCPGSCELDEICAADYPPTVCHTPCSAHADCEAPSACDHYADGSADGGRVLGCSLVCRPGTSEGCPPGTSCRMGFLVPLPELPGGPDAITFCSASRSMGAEGCACADTDSSMECAHGLSCEMPAAGRMCLRICAVGSECGGGVFCEATPRSVVIDGVQYGVCPRTDLAAPLTCD